VAVLATHYNPLSASLTEAKRDGTQLSNAACMRLEDDLEQAEHNWEFYYTK
jgi:hypothetical protein